MLSPQSTTNRFSLAEARSHLRDLFQPRPWIYWTDFLSTILAGHVCYSLTRRIVLLVPEPLGLRLSLQVFFFLATCALYFRAVNFIHEVIHLPERKFHRFRLAWNLLCGIPFFMPSFTYETHLDHHRRKHFGTEHDGEYLALSRGSPFWIAVYLSQCLWLPLLAVVRFGLLTPLAWISPKFRCWLHRHASSMVMDPRYLRPLPTAAHLKNIRLQELLCFALLLGIALVPPLLMGRWPIPFIVQGYAISVVLIFCNSLRTIAAHRWTSDGHEGTFVDQMLDSVNIDSGSLDNCLLNPVGLRYHALHHLFPSLPYHNLSEAHRRLMAALPADSLYRQTNEPSVWSAVSKVWRRAAESRRLAREEARVRAPWQGPGRTRAGWPGLERTREAPVI